MFKNMKLMVHDKRDQEERDATFRSRLLVDELSICIRV
jgi:hypothetical protein